MNQTTVTNSYTHTHEDRPFAPPHKPTSDKEIADRTRDAEEAAYDAVGAIIDLLGDRVVQQTGETDPLIIKSGVAQAFVRAGATGLFILPTGDTQAGRKFGESCLKSVLEAAIIAVSLARLTR